MAHTLIALPPISMLSMFTRAKRSSLFILVVNAEKKRFLSKDTWLMRVLLSLFFSYQMTPRLRGTMVSMPTVETVTEMYFDGWPS